MKAPPMNAKQRRFFALYFGKDDRLAGNATRCYKAAYGLMDDRSAQVSGSRLLKRPEFAEWLAALEAEAMQELEVNAAFVKSQSVRMLQRAMGDEPTITTTIETQDDGSEIVRTSERYEYDPTAAHKALQLIGQHKDVQAFTVTVEHTHTHQLEQRLAARSKVIEGQAAQVIAPEPATSPALPHSQPVINDDRGEGSHPAQGQDIKRGCIKEDVAADFDNENDDPRSENRGA